MKMTTCIAIVLSLSVAPCTFAQDHPSESDSTRLGSFISSPRRRLVAPELLDAPDEWIERSLAWVDMILDEYPPSIPEHPVRRAALIRLDDILHIESAPRKALVQKFFHTRMEKVIEQIETTTVTEGMRIWKLYNHGFFVRTKSVSFTFDIVAGARRSEGFAVDSSLMERLVTQSDATFISHRHGDHASPQAAKLFIDQGKPVIASEGLWQERPNTRYRIPEDILELREQLSKKLTYPVRSDTTVHEIPIQNGAEVLQVIRKGPAT